MSDRHYGLFANNQHPLQLQVYEEYNRFLRQVYDKATHERYEYINQRMTEIKEERTQLLNHQEGESLSFDDLTDIYMQVMGETRERLNMSLNTKTKTGEINDYLEVRRPFGSAT